MLSKKDFPPLPSQMQSSPRPTKNVSRRSQVQSEVTKHKRPTSINNLPDELIVEILDYLPGIDLRDFHLLALASLSLTNRRLHNIVSDRLYAAYDSFFCTPYPFLRTVLSNPDLASHVKAVSFSYGPNVHSERPPYAPSIADKQIVKDGLRRLGSPKFDWKQWASDCNDHNVDPELIHATILMYTPNITRLEIDDGASFETPGEIPRWLTNLRKIANGMDFGRVHKFMNLQTIRVDVQYLKLRHLAPLFRLRSVRKVTLVGLFEWTSVGEATKEELRRLFPLRASHVDELQLEMSFVDDVILDVVISSIKKLKTFRYWSSTDHYATSGRGSDEYWGISEQAGYEAYDESSATNSWFSMAKSLGSHGSWLDTLSWRDGIHNAEDQYYRDPHRWLSGFDKISHLEVPMGALAQQTQTRKVEAESIVANVPRSVESLTVNMIHDGRADFRESLDHMGRYMHRHAPSLREVKVIYHSLLTAPTYDWDGLGKMLLDQGISFEFVHSIADEEAESEGNWSPYGSGADGTRSDGSDESDSSGYEESLYSNEEA